MKWQEKVKAYKAARRISWRALAEVIGISNTALASALESGNAWETVRTAIRLAREMGTTVEDLFDPETDWPPEPLLHPATAQEKKMAIAALERLKATAALERLAGGSPPTARPVAKKKAKKRPRQPK